MKVPLLDLKARYLSIRDEVQEAIHKVLESQRFVLAPPSSSPAGICSPEFLKVGGACGRDRDKVPILESSHP